MSGTQPFFPVWGSGHDKRHDQKILHPVENEREGFDEAKEEVIDRDRLRALNREKHEHEV